MTCGTVRCSGPSTSSVASSSPPGTGAWRTASVVSASSSLSPPPPLFRSSSHSLLLFSFAAPSLVHRSSSRSLLLLSFTTPLFRSCLSAFLHWEFKMGLIISLRPLESLVCRCVTLVLLCVLTIWCLLLCVPMHDECSTLCHEVLKVFMINTIQLLSSVKASYLYRLSLLHLL